MKQKNFDSSVTKLTDAYQAMRSDKGDEHTREVLSGARAAAVGILRPLEATAALRLYQATEKAVFGNLGPLNTGEEDLTNADQPQSDDA